MPDRRARLNGCVPTFQTMRILLELSDEIAAWLCWEIQSALEQVRAESGTEVDTGWLSESGLGQSVSQSVRERVNCECDECPVGWSTHHPDPSHGTVVPRRGAQGTNSHSVAWISCQSVRQSRLFANYYTVHHSEQIPCPCICNLRPGSPYQPARPALMCYEYAAPWLGHVWTVLP